MKLKDYRNLVVAYNHMSSNDPKRKSLKKQIDQEWEEIKKAGGKNEQKNR